MATVRQMEFQDLSILPSVPERKGSLYLRSNHVKYSSKTLNFNWHADRESEPKDYDVAAAENNRKDLQRSTYDRIGNFPDKNLLSTATEAAREVSSLKDDYRTIATQLPVVDDSNFELNTKRLGAELSPGGILPRHTEGYNARHLESTHKRDYQNPYKCTPPNEEEQAKTHDTVDTKFRRQQSQFTDTADYRRKGVSTWQDYR